MPRPAAWREAARIHPILQFKLESLFYQVVAGLAKAINARFEHF